jgi:hypothetical protein
MNYGTLNFLSALTKGRKFMETSPPDGSPRMPEREQAGRIISPGRVLAQHLRRE